MNWGHAIAIVCILFIASMLGLVYFSFQQNVQLVETNYYEKELNYQKTINSRNNVLRAGGIDEPIQKSDSLIVALPVNTYGQLSKFTVSFQRPSDEKLDKSFDIQNSLNNLIIPLRAMQSGYYTYKILWDYDGNSYLYENTLMVQ